MSELRIAGHRIGEKLGEGAMATLWRADAAGDPATGDAPPGTTRVLKRAKLGAGSHPACFAGFEAERMILARLSGPHVPALIDGGDTLDDDDGPWLIEEWIDGAALSVAAQNAPRPVAEVAATGIAVAAALHAIHRQNVVHHDVKPQHVLFRVDGTAVLIDFGLAAHGDLPDFAADALHGGDMPLGTPAWMAPEVVRGLRGNPQSDIFSLGVMLYLLATGQLPFGTPVTRAGMRRRLWLEPPPPRAWRPELPEWLQEIIMRCLAVRLEDRYATAAQVAHDLAHPGQVTITARGRALQGGGWRAALRRWWQTRRAEPVPHRTAAAHLARAPYILVAIDTGRDLPGLATAMHDVVRRIASSDGSARISCVGVLALAPSAGQEEAVELERSQRTQLLMALHHWARELALPPGRLRFHVLDGSDAATAIIDHARTHHADQIVIGARGSSVFRRLLGSVSARVAAEAPCSVTVVRAPDFRDAGSSTPHQES